MSHAATHLHRCGKCGELYSTALPGCRWFNRKAKPRYVHPGCEQPAKDWKPAAPANPKDPR